MTYSDKERLQRLEKTFELNFRLTHLYSLYLERFPELITEKMIDELTRDGDITVTDALVALLCEVFGLDDARGGDDRRLIRDYIRPSVRLLDAGRYTENKYYRNIKIEGVRDGSWELRLESYAPYRGVICGDIEISQDFSEIPPLGFFTETFRFPAVLEDGNEWMTLTPVDLDTCEAAIESARGKVVTFGLGLGYFAYMASEKECVTSVTVVERSPEVIRLFEKHILPQFSHPEKIKIVLADAFDYAEQVMPGESYDFAFVDTWRDASDGAPMYERMKSLEHLSKNTEFSYWIENFLISRRRALCFGELCDKLELDAPDAPKSYEEFEKRLKNYGNCERI